MIKRAIYMLLIAVCMSDVCSGIVMAAPNQGPNPNDFTESNAYGNDWAGYGRRVDYVVATSIYNYIPVTKVKIYLPTPTGQVTINNKDICYGTFRNNGNNYDNPDDGNILGSSGPAVSFDIPGGGAPQWGWWNGAAGCDNLSLVFNLSGASLDPNTNMYLYTLTATANPSNARYMNTFSVVGPAGSIISQDSSLSASSGFGMNQAYPMINGNNPSNTQFPPAPYRNYTNWSIKFAPDCTVTTPTVSRTIETYDDDNFAISQSDNWAVQPRRFSMRLSEYNRAGVFQGYIVPSSIFFPDGAGSFIDLGGGLYEVYTSGNNKRSQLTYTFKRDMIYSWDLYNVYIDNTLQFRVPFDSVYYYQECALPKATLKSAMAVSPVGVMNADDTATFSPSLLVSGYNGLPFTVNCTIARVAYSPTGVPSSLGGQPCVTPSGDPNIQINSGATPIALRQNTYNSPSVAAGTRICDTMTITNPTDSGYFAAPADKDATSCIIIGKTPLVTFMGGDVWAGGNFAAIDPACNKQSKIQTVARQLSDGSLAGSGVEYSAFALGKITQFGSAGRAFLNTTLGTSSLTFSNLDGNNLGNYGATQHCIEDYVGRFASAAPMAAGAVNVNTQPSQTRHITGSASFSGAMQPGSQQIYLVDGDVTISGPITYTGSYSAVDQVPSLVIISKADIRVASTVGQMDGLYVARGTFYTCYPKVEPATINTCGTKLNLNGAVIANRLDLFRTSGASGSIAGRKDPAETFTLNPEMYLRSALSTTSQPTLTVTDIRELPARY